MVAEVRRSVVHVVRAGLELLDQNEPLLMGRSSLAASHEMSQWDTLAVGSVPTEVRQADVGVQGDDPANFTGRDVFGLPPESVAEPVNQLEVGEAEGKTRVDGAQQVVGVEPHITVFKGTAHHFFPGGFLDIYPSNCALASTLIRPRPGSPGCASMQRRSLS